MHNEKPKTTHNLKSKNPKYILHVNQITNIKADAAICNFN